MPPVTEQSITDDVVARLDSAASPRVRAVSEAVVRHLHALVREVRPSQAEWAAAIALLTRTGQMCSDTRQEFILLSDILGVSMLVDVINHPVPEQATETTVLGPFYVASAPHLPLGSSVVTAARGEPLFVEGTVRDPAGHPVPGAWVSVWQSDAEGFYDVQRVVDGKVMLDLRARFEADARGRFWFHSIVPRYYPVPEDGPVGDILKAQGRHANRPAHVHFMIGAPGFQTLVTQVYIDGCPYLDSDVVFGVKRSLVHRLVPIEPGCTPDGHELGHAAALLHQDFVLAHEGAAA
jgi:hydroxyquinol 1,2-dioxygenase